MTPQISVGVNSKVIGVNFSLYVSVLFLVAKSCYYISFDHGVVKPKNSENKISSASRDPPEISLLYNIFTIIFNRNFILWSASTSEMKYNGYKVVICTLSSESFEFHRWINAIYRIFLEKKFLKQPNYSRQKVLCFCYVLCFE